VLVIPDEWDSPAIVLESIQSPDLVTVGSEGSRDSSGLRVQGWLRVKG
jgi:hypothetical protein